MRTIQWEESSQQLKIIDQNALPAELRFIHLKDHHEVADAIHRMVVRGAPAIGVTAAYGMVLAALSFEGTEREKFLKMLQSAAQVLNTARPTAVNLSWATHRMLEFASQTDEPVDVIKGEMLQLAHKVADEDVEVNKAMSRFGAELIDDGDRIVHHCNTGALATVDYGTALGVIRMAHEQGKRIHVYVDETRPRLQGSRLTAWELQQYGIPFEIITDSSSGLLMRMRKVDKVIFGADRVAANGDVVNKIGTYMLALAAYDNAVPAYSVFPMSTVDYDCPNGEAVTIEERDPAEVLDLRFRNELVSPHGAKALNLAFDITPHRLLSGLVTEHGVLYPPFFKSLANIRIPWRKI